MIKNFLIILLIYCLKLSILSRFNFNNVFHIINENMSIFIVITIQTLYAFLNNIFLLKRYGKKKWFKEYFLMEKINDKYYISIISGFLFDFFILLDYSYGLSKNISIFSSYYNSINYSLTFLYVLIFILSFSYIMIMLIDRKIYSFLDNKHENNQKHEQKQNILDKGIYKYIRHPRYLFILINYIILIIIYKSLLGIVFFMIFITYPLEERIKYEEKDLIKKYPEYKEYQKRTNKLIPFKIFRRDKNLSIKS